MGREPRHCHVDRATIANMAPEYGATMGSSPSMETVQYLKATGRSGEHCQTYENYYRAQGLFGLPAKGDIDYSTDIELDLASVGPSVAGPKRPQDRIALPDLKQSFDATFSKPVSEGGFGKDASALEADAISLKDADRDLSLDHGSVLIAAITSCTNTSNPGVMLGAGLLAKRRSNVDSSQPCGQGFACPGFTCSGDYLSKGFNLSGSIGFQSCGMDARLVSATVVHSPNRLKIR